MPEGPILEDFTEDAPVSKDPPTMLACPVNFPQDQAELTETEELCARLKSEMTAMRPWYEMAVKKRGRTTVGVSGMDPDKIPDFICSFLEGDVSEPPRKDISLPYVLNLAIDDLKAYYFEGITSQPGQEAPSSKALSDWFWGETTAAKVLFRIKDVCKKSENGLMKIVGKVLIVPVDQGHRNKQQ